MSMFIRAISTAPSKASIADVIRHLDGFDRIDDWLIDKLTVHMDDDAADENVDGTARNRPTTTLVTLDMRRDYGEDVLRVAARMSEKPSSVRQFFAIIRMMMRDPDFHCDSMPIPLKGLSDLIPEATKVIQLGTLLLIPLQWTEARCDMIVIG
jgi:hypothetical protein